MSLNNLLDIGIYLLPVVVLFLVFIVQFVRLRVQNMFAARPDPHLGRKAVCHLFLSISIVTGLVGATISSVDLMARAFVPLKQAQIAPVPVPIPGDPVPAPAAVPAVPAPAPVPWFNAAQRIGTALILAGLLHGTLFAVALRMFTNDRNEPAVRRAHIGTRMVFAGMFWMLADTAALLLLFAEGNTDWDQMSMWTGVGLVWGPTAAVHLWLLLRGRDRTSTPAATRKRDRPISLPPHHAAAYHPRHSFRPAASPRVPPCSDSKPSSPARRSSSPFSRCPCCSSASA